MQTAPAGLSVTILTAAALSGASLCEQRVWDREASRALKELDVPVIVLS